MVEQERLKAEQHALEELFCNLQDWSYSSDQYELVVYYETDTINMAFYYDRDHNNSFGVPLSQPTAGLEYLNSILANVQNVYAQAIEACSALKAENVFAEFNYTFRDNSVRCYIRTKNATYDIPADGSVDIEKIRGERPEIVEKWIAEWAKWLQPLLPNCEVKSVQSSTELVVTFGFKSINAPRITVPYPQRDEYAPRLERIIEIYHVFNNLKDAKRAEYEASPIRVQTKRGTAYPATDETRINVLPRNHWRNEAIDVEVFRDWLNPEDVYRIDDDGVILPVDLDATLDLRLMTLSVGHRWRATTEDYGSSEDGRRSTDNPSINVEHVYNEFARFPVEIVSVL